MTEVRLYGRSIGYGSHAQVTRGFQAGLAAHGINAHLVAVDDDADDEAPPVPGAFAPFAFYTGPLNNSQIMHRNARHERRFTMVAPNSDRMPLKLLHNVAVHATDIMVPSRWAEDVIVKLLAEIGAARSVLVVPHGVSADFRPNPAERAVLKQEYPASFRVLHLSTSDRERKGTRELIQAWNLAMRHRMLPEKAYLLLVLDVAADMALKTWLADERVVPHQSIHFVSRMDSPPSELASTLTAFHLVCQPSRGEGFGLIPLEARACGVPVAATLATGHSEHMDATTAGLTVIPTGGAEWIDDFAGASAPSLSVEHLATALGRAYQDWPKLEEAAAQAAPAVAAKWSWQSQLSRLADIVKGA